MMSVVRCSWLMGNQW